MISSSLKCYLFILILSFASHGMCFTFGSTYNNAVIKKGYRVNWPWLGIGLFCNGCPARSCEEDPAVVTGYCCGCAKFSDVLPVQCSASVRCPLNNLGLCHDYEYMLRCCC